MTDPSPPGGIENEVVVVLDVVSPASTTENPCTPVVNARKSAAAGKDSTEVSNISSHLLQSSSQHSEEAKVQHAP